MNFIRKNVLFFYKLYLCHFAEELYISPRRRRSSVNCREHIIFARKICIKNQQDVRILHDSCPKNYQNALICMIFARKIYKIPEFYMIFARKMPEFYVIIARKKYFYRILGGHVPPPLAPRLLRLHIARHSVIFASFLLSLCVSV